MSDIISKSYTVSGDDFTTAGEASGQVKKMLKQLGLPSEFIRRVSVAMYEGEINMVIHANGGTAYAEIAEDKIIVTLDDIGPGIPDIDLAMTEGYSTADETVRSLGFGAGMGLPNMKKYADDIHIESTVGVGTKVMLTFIL